MPLDTGLKRGSVQAMTLWLVRPFPTGTINDSRRAMVAWLYSGFDYASDDVAPGATTGGRRGSFRAFIRLGGRR